ncbi:hypothetical protein GGP55_002635 [Salinibacter ruber]|nr:hypothetical protein [Salinibacter ruber]
MVRLRDVGSCVEKGSHFLHRTLSSCVMKRSIIVLAVRAKGLSGRIDNIV